MVVVVNYSSKVVVITGASRGIGKSLAYYFANLGCNLIITYNKSRNLSNYVVRDIKKKKNVQIDNIKCDLKNEDDINNLYKFIRNKYQKVDILINNAALSLDSDFQYKTKEEFMEVLEVNVVGTFLMIKYLSKIMDETGYIFNISSTDGIDTYNRYSIDYCASKAGINNMTMNIAGIVSCKVISICPNWVDTETIREIDQDYLQSELERVGQEKLIESITICKVIDKCIKNNTETGSIIRIDGDINE